VHCDEAANSSTSILADQGADWLEHDPHLAAWDWNRLPVRQ
jgi:hypothetical protein